MKTLSLFTLASFVALVSCLAPVHVEAAESCPTKNIVEIASEAGNFKTLLAAATAAGLAETLAGPSELTVFAPTDEAFAKLPEGTVEALLNDIPTLKSILLYHVVGGKSDANSLLKMKRITTVNGKDVIISTRGGALFVNDSQVIVRPIPASNGVIYVIDSVLLP